MDAQPPKSCTAFAGTERIASGDLTEVVSRAKDLIDGGDQRAVLVFDDTTSELVELDLRGTAQDVLGRLLDTAGENGPCTAAATPGHPASAHPASAHRAPGRPRLGVVGREVTLLPRHWEWLNVQPGGASVALRKLVEQARRDNVTKDRVRRSQESAYRFMSAMAGNEAGFEETSRALFAGDSERFDAHSESWPPDIREHARMLAAGAFAVDADE